MLETTYHVHDLGTMLDKMLTDYVSGIEAIATAKGRISHPQMISMAYSRAEVLVETHFEHSPGWAAMRSILEETLKRTARAIIDEAHHNA